MGTYVLYHGNKCLDGFGSAYAAWKRLGDSATYIPCAFQDRPKPLSDIPDGSDVYILDYSFKRADLVAANERMNCLHVIDHHVTAQEDLEGLEYCHFDMTKSGAYLAWEAFHPGTPIPSLIQHISDRDLWKFELPDTHAVHMALLSFPMDFKLWDELAADVPILALEGRVLMRMAAQQVSDICDKVVVQSWNIAGQEFKVAMCNTTVYWSEVGHELLNRYRDVDFVASYTVAWSIEGQGLECQWSLRSDANHCDVSKIAKSFGGGGHRAAAGFMSDLQLLTLVSAG